jgi:hypothetical protein
VLNTGVKTVTAVGTVFEIGGLKSSSSDGKLLIPQTATGVTIGAVTDGNGNVEFLPGNPVAFATAASSFGNTGTTTFPDGATVTAVALTFAGAVDFGGDLDLSGVSGTVEFGGTASFANGKKITMAVATDIITLGKDGGALAVDGQKIIAANGAADAVLTPAVTTILTFGLIDGKPALTQDNSAAAVHQIAVSGGDVTLADNAVYKVNSAALKVGTLVVDGVEFDVGSSGSLVLDADGTNGAILTGTGSIVAGAAEITGGTGPGSWKAGAGIATDTVTITSNAITASAATGTFTASTGTTAFIGVTAGTLVVQGNIALGVGVGSVVLTGDGNTGGTLLLKSGAIPGLLTTGGATTNPGTIPSPYTTFVLNDSTDDGTVTGPDGSNITMGTIALDAANASLASPGAVVGKIGGLSTGGVDVYITSAVAAPNALTINNTVLGIITP